MERTSRHFCCYLTLFNIFNTQSSIGRIVLTTVIKLNSKKFCVSISPDWWNSEILRIKFVVSINQNSAAPTIFIFSRRNFYISVQNAYCASSIQFPVLVCYCRCGCSVMFKFKRSIKSNLV